MSPTIEHVIITAHGIRTYGEWQRRLQRLVQKADPNILFANFQYGLFDVLKFIFPPTRWLLRRRFQRELLVLIARYPSCRFDLVGHSFGTHLIVLALYNLREDPRVK